MNKSIWLIGCLLIGLIFVSGCTQQPTKYVCPDGITVSDASLCPKQQAQAPIYYPTGNTCGTTTNVVGWFPSSKYAPNQVCEISCIGEQDYEICKTIPTCTVDKPILNSQYDCVAGGIPIVSKFSEIKEDMTEDAVIALVGTPYDKQTITTPKGNIVEYWYYSDSNNVVWQVAFSNGTVSVIKNY